ncbi:photosynthetic NDH subunit of subcomplex B 1, chloroplastic-like [Zingiber officinale]|uniref:photosynthetic NDH subunit of subcomplex B 1, chloroplastic-like n=1 Tax=Zingiber officinale TaxID=94328 RepID=UPI001C4C72E3|nr:photosynthetic NDH subunit of subcomplex B 1, chloroplastic-like [Zingiber officinale]
MIPILGSPGLFLRGFGTTRDGRGSARAVLPPVCQSASYSAPIRRLVLLDLLILLALLLPTSPAAVLVNRLTPRGRLQFVAAAAKKKKNPWLDPFDCGEDPDIKYGSLFIDGKQEEDPRPPNNPSNPYDFLKFPMGFNVELASLASKVRGDVRLCCCVISGGVYENLLFFPVIQLIKDRYLDVQIDVIASPRGKQVYEVNKNVRWVNVYDPDEDFPEPAEYVNMIGLLKNRYYDSSLSTKLAGLGHAAFLFMTSARDKVSYVYPNVNAAGAGLLLTETFTSPTMNLSERGYHMYDEMEEWLGRPFRSVPRHPVSPLRVSISKKLRAYVEEKYSKVGVQKGGFVVIHGIETDSVASMRSKGDNDSLLPIQVWVEIVKGLRGVKPLFVIPHEKVREDVEEVVRDDTHILFITTPGQLAALVDDAIGVIATNTAALQLANARNKPRPLSCDLSKRCVKDNYGITSNIS